MPPVSAYVSFKPRRARNAPPADVTEALAPRRMGRNERDRRRPMGLRMMKPVLKANRGGQPRCSLPVSSTRPLARSLACRGRPEAALLGPPCVVNSMLTAPCLHLLAAPSSDTLHASSSTRLCARWSLVSDVLNSASTSALAPSLSRSVAAVEVLQPALRLSRPTAGVWRPCRAAARATGAPPFDQIEGVAGRSAGSAHWLHRHVADLLVQLDHRGTRHVEQVRLELALRAAMRVCRRGWCESSSEVSAQLWLEGGCSSCDRRATSDAECSTETSDGRGHPPSAGCASRAP